MGCDIHSFAEIRKEGKWEKVTEKIFGTNDQYNKKTESPFDWRSYTLFAFLAGVRNYDHCDPISPPKNLPDDSEYLNQKLSKGMDFNYGYFSNGVAYTKKDQIEKDFDYHNKSWLTLKELLDFNYEKKFWNRRVSKVIKNKKGDIIGSNGAALSEEGEGTIISYRDNLGEGFFDELEILKSLGNPEDVRIVFWFDN